MELTSMGHSKEKRNRERIKAEKIGFNEMNQHNLHDLPRKDA
jgi:hypothetical protein